MSASAHARIAELGLVLPPVGKPAGAYKPCLVVDRLAYVSGHLPLQADGTLVKGKVGVDLDADAGKAAARLTGLSILATLRTPMAPHRRIRRPRDLTLSSHRCGSGAPEGLGIIAR